jgi:hypothetical protein
VDHPPVPRDSIIAYLNLDMIGRGGRVEERPDHMASNLMLGPDSDVMVMWSRSMSTELGRLIDAVNTGKHHNLRFDYAFNLSVGGEMVCFSDHCVYARHGIPIAMFFTGLHVDYHRVTDEPQYIDYPQMERLTKYLYDLLLALGTRHTRPVVDQPPLIIR